MKLQEQPFHVLLRPVQRPGALVTREELKKAVSPADTLSILKHGVNTAIKKIRQSLGRRLRFPILDGT